METSPNRRAVLLEAFRAEPNTACMRPPGADLVRFRAACNGCGACADACPQGIVLRDPSGRPALSFASGACTFCGLCADVCPTGALDAARAGPEGWPWRAAVSERCLSAQGISCRSCQDACDASAIRFRLATGGRALALIDRDACTGCGACASSCPAAAIEFEAGPAEADSVGADDRRQTEVAQ